VGLFDWLGMGRQGRRADGAEPATAWHVYRDGGDIVAQDGRGGDVRAALAGARSVRIVPLTGGNQHAHLRNGWQVALARPDGDVLLGKPVADWRSARDLAQLVCDQAALPLDELTQKMFSRVGQYTAAGDA
jgi:hypothetical protein